jgi:putative tricarboxylic transport membrane protein
MTIDRVLGLGALLLAGAVCLTALGYGIGRPNAPGAGFWPFLVALIMAGLGAALAIRPDRSTPAPSETGANRKGFWIALGSMGLFVPMLVPLGYPTSMVLLLVIQLRWVERRSWTTALLVASAASIVSFGVFRLLLHVPLPAGILPLPRNW